MYSKMLAFTASFHKMFYYRVLHGIGKDFYFNTEIKWGVQKNGQNI